MTFLIFLFTVLNAHELYVDAKDVTARLIQIRFSDGTPFRFEKCELFFLEQGEYKPFQIVYTDAFGEFTFLPKNPGKYKVQCFRADGHGIQKELEITKISENQQKEENFKFDYYIKYIFGFLVIVVVTFLFVKFKGKVSQSVLILIMLAYFQLQSHYGTTSFGSVGIRGQDAAIETSIQRALIKDLRLYLMKLDTVQFKTFIFERDEEIIENQFFMYGIGYGLDSYLSKYFFLPYNQKTRKNRSYNTSSFIDLSVYLVLGIKYDETFYLNPQQENLDDLQNYHFSIYLGTTIPTGLPNIKIKEG